MPAQRPLGGLALVVVLSSLCGCDDDKAQVTTRDPRVVVNVGWGAGSADLGKTQPADGAPVGPMSFAVGADGRVWVLDQVNHRVQVYASGALHKSVTLPIRHFEDIALEGDGFALVDLHQSPALTRFDATGAPLGEIALYGPELPEPSRVTALTRTSTGAFVEVDAEYSVQISDATGDASDRSVVPGVVAGEGSVLSLELDGLVARIYRHPSGVGPPAALATVGVSEPIRERSLLAVDSSGRVLLGLVSESEQSDPEIPPVEQHVLVVLDASGSELSRHQLTVPEGIEEVFRSVKLGADDEVYSLELSAQGAQIVKVLP